jgi:hypothetical protein
MIVMCDAQSVNHEAKMHGGYTPDADGEFWRPTIIFFSVEITPGGSILSKVK